MDPRYVLATNFNSVKDATVSNIKVCLEIKSQPLASFQNFDSHFALVLSLVLTDSDHIIVPQINTSIDTCTYNMLF